MQTYRLFFQRDSKKRVTTPCEIHEEAGGKSFAAKEVRIYGKCHTEFNPNIKGVPAFVVYCRGELKWSDDGTIAHLFSEERDERNS